MVEGSREGGGGERTVWCREVEGGGGGGLEGCEEAG